METLGLFVLDGSGSCAPDACVAFGEDTVSWNVTAGSTWYVVVDGQAGDTSPYELTLSVVDNTATVPSTETACGDGIDDDADGDFDCDDADCASASECAVETCVPSYVLGCGDTHAWSNDSFGSWNVVDSYSCNSWNESGPEYTYLFQATSSGSATATLSGMSADLDLFVLDNNAGSCDADGCLAVGNSSATFDVVAGESYYVVVDGFNGAISDYELELSCE